MKTFLRNFLSGLILQAAIIPCGAQTNDLASDHPNSEEVLLLTSFKANGQFGPTLSVSTDGVHFTTFNQGKPFFQPRSGPKVRILCATPR